MVEVEGFEEFQRHDPFRWWRGPSNWKGVLDVEMTLHNSRVT